MVVIGHGLFGGETDSALKLDRGTGTCQGLEIFIVLGRGELLSAV